MTLEISLHRVTAQNWRATLALDVHPEQLHFVASSAPIAAIILAKAYVRPGGLVWTPYVIDAGDEHVGMVAVAAEADSPQHCWIYHFFIDHHAQHKGVGMAAIKALVRLIAAEYPACREMLLTVHPDNRRAQTLYQRAGFQPTGETRDDEQVYALSLTR